MTEKDEIFIQIKGIGFTLLLDKRMKHNFISPAFLAFFNLGVRQMYSLPKNNIKEVREFGISLKQNQLFCMFNGIPLQCFRLIVIKAIRRQRRHQIH